MKVRTLTLTLLTACLVAQADNLVPNPGFESGREGVDGWTHQGEARWADDTAHSGKRSLMVRQTRPDQECRWTSDSFRVEPGSCVVSAWMKSAMVAAPDPGYGPKVETECFDKDGKSLGARTQILRPAQEVKPVYPAGGPNILWHDWQYFEKLVQVPPGAASMRLTFGLHRPLDTGNTGTTGTAWLDDVAVAKGDQRLLTAPRSKETASKTTLHFNTARDGAWTKDLSRKPYGTIFLPGEPLDFLCRGPAGKSLRLSYSARTAGWNVVASGEATPGPDGDFAFSIPAEAVKVGVYHEILLQAFEGDALAAERLVSFGVLPETDRKDDFQWTFFSGMGEAGNLPVASLMRRLGMTVARCDFFFTEAFWPAADKPISLPDKGLLPQRIELSHQLGSQPLVNLHVGCPKWALFRGDAPVGPDPEYLKTYVTALVGKYKDKVKLWQFGNEVNPITPAQQKRYTAQFKAFSQAVHAADPQAKVVMGSVHLLDPVVRWLLESDVSADADLLDAHYNTPAQVADIRAKLKARTGRDIPFILTEIGGFEKDNDLDRVSVMAQQYTEYLAVGVKMVMWCWFGPWQVGDSSGDSPYTDGNFVSPLAHFPSPLFFTHYQMSQLLGGFKPADAIKAPDKVKAYLFNKGERMALALWSEKGAVLPLGLTLPAQEVEYADVAGRRERLASLDGRFHVAVDEAPVFLFWNGSSAGVSCDEEPWMLELKNPLLVRGAENRLEVAVKTPSARLLSLSRLPGQRGDSLSLALGAYEPLARHVIPLALERNGAVLGIAACPVVVCDPITLNITTGSGAPVVTVENGSAVARRGKLTLLSEFTGGLHPLRSELPVELAAHDKAKFPVPVEAGRPPELPGRVWASLALEGGKSFREERCLTLLAAPRTGGWEAATPIPLRGGTGEHWGPRTYNGAARGGAWMGDNDLSAEFRLRWDDEFLHILADVKDDDFCNRNVDGMLWNGDAIEVVVETRGSGGEPKSFYKILAALTAKGPQALFRFGISNIVDLVPLGGKVQVERRDGGLRYELAVPWKLLKTVPKPGMELGVSFAVSDDDGAGRCQFLQRYGTITDPRYNRWLFASLLLEP